MNFKKSLLTISVVGLVGVLLTSGFVIPAANAQTNKQISILAKIPSGLENKYSVIFQVCADDTIMRAPEVVISSDSAIKNVKLNKVISPNTCRTTASVVDAMDANTIKVKKVDKTVLNKMITSAEKNLAKIKAEISKTNDDLNSLLDTIPGNVPTKSENIKKVNDMATKLSELRKNLQDARQEYYRLLYILKT